jgi:uncharacterized protein YndB with AHSA1/START domain
MAAKGNVATIAKPELVITRVVDAPPRLVFEIWTDPEHLVQWWGPQGFTTPFHEMDVRPDGAFRICMRSPDGTDHWVRGVYREVVAPERLVFTWAWEDATGKPGHETLVTVTFAAQGARTSLTVHHTGFESVNVRDEHQGGWTESLDRLAAHLGNA